MAQKTDELGLYLVKCGAGNFGEPGAPLLQLSLLVNASTGSVTGQAEVTQAVKAPGDKVRISELTGRVQASGFGEYTKLVALQGTATIALPPPAIGSYQTPFSAHFAINDAWTGKGGWTLGHQTVDNVPIRAT